MSDGEKLDKVKRIFKDSYIAEKDIDVSPDDENVQLNYSTRLSNDISRTQSYLKQAEMAINLLQKIESSLVEDETFALKKEIIALHELNSKIGYIPDKTDSIGIASASYLINEMISQQKYAISNMQAANKRIEDEIKVKHELRADYERMAQMLDQKITANKSNLESIKEKISDFDVYPITETTMKRKFDEKLKVAYGIEEDLLSFLKRVIIKFLAVTDWESEEIMTEKDLQKNVNSLLGTIDGLVTNLVRNSKANSTSDWLIIEPTSTERRLIKHLILNGILSERDDSNQTRFIVKLRDIGLNI